MKFDILTIFPEFFDSPLKQSIIRRALENGLIEVDIHNIRDYAFDSHKTTDDYPYGGGAGMVMKVEPTVRAIDAVRNGLDEKVILVTPQGAPLNQEMAHELSGLKKLVVVCGRYEGVDERIRGFVDMEISIGDYVLMGGEIPALVILESVTRLIPGVLGSHKSIETESFSNGLLEYPQYTRPRDFRGLKVPSVLLSGNHKEIERWRQKESLRRTLGRRPELIERQSIHIQSVRAKQTKA
jgi:tRNA (guanine37-N1)-methyltransferase